MLQLGTQAAVTTVQLTIQVNDWHAFGQVSENFLSQLVVSCRVRDPADDWRRYSGGKRQESPAGLRRVLRKLAEQALRQEVRQHRTRVGTPSDLHEISTTEGSWPAAPLPA